MDKKIGVVTRDSEQLVECTYENQGLGVHRWPPGIMNNWTVTHIASGLSVAKFGESETQAIKVADDLVPLTDWTRPADKLHSGASELGSQARRIVERNGMALTDGYPVPNSISMLAP